MTNEVAMKLFDQHVVIGDPGGSNYFALIKALVAHRNQEESESAAHKSWENDIDKAYGLVEQELLTNQNRPVTPVSFGTSGWRGVLGKDLFVKSVSQVTLAVVRLYESLEDSKELANDLGVTSLDEAKRKGGVIGHDNRFGGTLLARAVADVLTANGFTVYFAGEATTGTLSAAVLGLQAAFSINLTPSHNPLEYGGFKFNAADAGPAAPSVTGRITETTGQIIARNQEVEWQGVPSLVRPCDALLHWIELVRQGKDRHGIDYDAIVSAFQQHKELALVVDCVHGASRIHIERLLPGCAKNLTLLRANDDPTFGGVAPEPSTENLSKVIETLQALNKKLKLGVIIDPDADRVRFTDGTREFTMNHFGAMAYHFLHEIIGKTGMVAKSVATSNFANRLALEFGEEIFEPRVGFKEFKPVIDRALVCFEESDGITVIGHTPEKDAYIGLFLALAMVEKLDENLGDYLAGLETKYGRFCPTKDAVSVSRKGEELNAALAGLSKYRVGTNVQVGEKQKEIVQFIDIDGYKLVLEDGSWLMIRPSGTEPKVRFYVEGNSEKSQHDLLETARGLLRDIGLF